MVLYIEYSPSRCAAPSRTGNTPHLTFRCLSPPAPRDIRMPLPLFTDSAALLSRRRRCPLPPALFHASGAVPVRPPSFAGNRALGAMIGCARPPTQFGSPQRGVEGRDDEVPKRLLPVEVCLRRHLSLHDWLTGLSGPGCSSNCFGSPARRM